MKPNYKLTKILIALEEAGLPEPRVKDYGQGDMFFNFGDVFLRHMTEDLLFTEIPSKSKAHTHSCLKDAITKLKSLIEGE